MRPALITVALGGLSIGVMALESHSADVRAFASRLRFLFQGEPSSAQAVLGTIAGSMMAVLSIVYSVLIMALSLASMQFSPRILGGLMRDPVSQRTFGLFIGTFVYCLLVLGSIGPDPAAVPRIAISLAIVLALVSLGQLVYFIHRTALGIQANHLIERVAAEATAVIDEQFAAPAGDDDPAPPDVPPSEDAVPVEAVRAGYVQLVDDVGLCAVAAEARVTIHVMRAPGDFVVAGGVLARVSPPSRATSEVRQAIETAFDVGSIRTMQQDHEYGVRQIVDVALKAISPAVNDPSTAVTCIDHLGHLLARLARRADPARVLGVEGGRVVQTRPGFEHTLDLAMNQLRQYARGDMSVSLRLMRALQEVARATTQPRRLARIGMHARLVAEGISPSFQAEDREPLERLAAEVAASTRRA